MIITGDTVAMESARKYRQNSSRMTAASTVGNKGNRVGISKGGMLSGNFMGFLNYSLEGLKGSEVLNRETGLLGNITDGNGHSKGARGVAPTEEEEPLLRSNLQIQFESLHYLLLLLFGERLPFEEAQGNATPKSNLSVPVTSTYTESYAYEETETTTFSTTGTVQTADGRRIEFGLDLTMSRSFYQEYTQSYSFIDPQYADPLVINLDGNVTSVSDQSFYFDLDCDGVEEELSALGSGSGFLALDKNGDGTINDGSELFGAQSGNGFYDLAQYDLDHNGWIDEADEIFQRLKIWTKDENGKDVYFSLKDAGVGALCLKAAATDFSLTDENNNPKAKIRQSGFYLRENGIPGLMQQVDMAM